MRGFGKFLGRLLLVLAVVAAGLWWFGPYEKVDLRADFEPRKFGEGVQVYFESIESGQDTITPGTEKRVVWQEGFKERRTPVSILYIHGFSATSEEIRPVPDRIADALGANLVYTRLQGHGQSGAALAEASAPAWMHDTAEGLAAARAVGERVVVIATSTGGTLAAAAALDPAMSDKVAAMILVSPNFGINDSSAGLLTWPAARYWVPLVAGQVRSTNPASEAQATYWTTTYPLRALMPMAALVKAVAALDFGATAVPALFWFSDDDAVVRPDITRKIAARWGGPSVMEVVTMGEGDDPSSHVVTGDIMSPGQTDLAVERMLAWLAGHGIE
ncbi:alpha/beta hydrolase [Seohaeicola saemankumensis]|nr:alpha/beta hydrolase [Seohaeicola saemankumensis]MCA0870004.1 alpha/beta hydrolase [Seohaeicola saemankumensis]